MHNIKSGDIFRHYKKGNLYTILHTGYNANNSLSEPSNVVIYMDHINNDIWVRDLHEFLEITENGVKRFEKINP